MKIDFTKILILKGSKTASAPKIGEIGQANHIPVYYNTD